MSDKPVALQMADELDSLCDPYDSAIATELRRLHDLVTEDSILQRRQRDEIAQLKVLNAELVEALKHAADCVQSNYLPDKCGHDWDDVIAKAEASK